MVKNLMKGLFAALGLAIIGAALYYTAIYMDRSQEAAGVSPVRVITVQEETKPLSEVDKLNFILDKYRNADVLIVSDGLALKPQDMWLKAKAALVYTKQDVADAGDWIGEYCYRLTGGSVLYFKYPDGRMTPVRDVFLKELATLNQRM